MARERPIYVVEVGPAARRDLRKLKKKMSCEQFERIDETIRNLCQDPRPHGSEKLSAEEQYRIRLGDYRILYAIDDKNHTVEIGAIRDRSDVYRKKRR